MSICQQTQNNGLFYCLMEPLVSMPRPDGWLVYKLAVSDCLITSPAKSATSSSSSLHYAVSENYQNQPLLMKGVEAESLRYLNVSRN